MDEVIEQIRELCAGKSVEEIEQELTESQFAERITNAPALAKYFFNLADEPEDDPVASPDDEPTADVDL